MIKVTIRNSFTKTNIEKMTDCVKFEINGFHAWFAVFVSEGKKYEYPLGDIISMKEQEG